jgi:LysR family pca operon transcriptional activator
MLRISQPAASKSIRELEDILACKLFDRSSRRLTLTPSGQVFQQHVGAAMQELGRAQTLATTAPRAITKLAVGVLPTAATELLPRAALAFRDGFPDCVLRVSTGPNWLLTSQLREGALDLVVGRMATAGTMEGLSFKHLYSESIIAVVRPGHSLLSLTDPTHSLGDFSLIVPPSGAVIAPLVRSFLVRHDVSPRQQAFESVSLAFGRRLVQSSDAIWFISRGVVACEVANGSLVELPLGEDLLGAPVGIAIRNDGPMSPEQKGLLAALDAAWR